MFGFIVAAGKIKESILFSVMLLLALQPTDLLLNT